MTNGIWSGHAATEWLLYSMRMGAASGSLPQMSTPIWSRPVIFPGAVLLNDAKRICSRRPTKAGGVFEKLRTAS
jgi:hypothetical protein